MEYSDLKNKATKSIEKAKTLILENIPNDEIICICVKGSYIQDYLLPRSDVDLVVILKTNQYLLKVYELSEQGKDYEPQFSISVYTIDELKTGSLDALRPRAPTSISRFNKSVNDLLFIFGSLPSGEYFKRSDERDIEIDIKILRTKILPEYEAGSHSFYELLKWVMRLTESEQRLNGFESHLWLKNAANAGKDHIINKALSLRSEKDVSVEEKKEFLLSFLNYINLLEKRIGHE